MKKHTAQGKLLTRAQMKQIIGGTEPVVGLTDPGTGVHYSACTSDSQCASDCCGHSARYSGTVCINAYNCVA